MLVSRSVQMHGNLLPAASNTIASIPDDLLFHVVQDRLHPRSAYATSIRHIAAQWVRVLDEIDGLRTEFLWEGTTTRFPTVIAEYAHLLHRINEHHDACYVVLRSLSDITHSKPILLDTQYLNRVQFPGWKKFLDATRQYREEHIGFIVNHLKHRQGELRSVYFHSEREFRPGYYLRDVLGAGVLGPSKKLHDSGNTAFSLARDLLLHLWWLYRIGDHLAEAIATAARVRHGLTLQVAARSNPESLWNQVLERTAGIRPEFFPDETPKPYPRVLYTSQPLSVSIEFPSTARGLRLYPKDLKVSGELTVDGEYLSNKLPYLGHLP